MTEQEILEVLNNMSAEEIEALENTTFPETVVKQAQAESATGELADALVGYGMLRADQEFAEAEAAELGGELAKEASAEFAEATEEVESAIEAGFEATGLLEIEDEAEMHKQAQAAAGLIFSGYTSQLEKHAAKGGKAAQTVGKLLKDKANKFVAGAKATGKQVVKHVKKHKGEYAAGLGGAAAGYGAMAVKKKMDKKASECTREEIAQEVFAKIATDATIGDGLGKCAAAGHHVGEKMMKHLKGAGKAVGKHMGKHKNKYLAGGAGVAAGVGAHKATGK